MKHGDIYLERKEALDRLERAGDNVVASQGLGRLVAKVSLRLAERHFERVDRVYTEVWPDPSLAPGDILNRRYEDGSALFGLVQSDGSISFESVPAEPIVSSHLDAYKK